MCENKGVKKGYGCQGDEHVTIIAIFISWRDFLEGTVHVLVHVPLDVNIHDLVHVHVHVCGHIHVHVYVRV